MVLLVISLAVELLVLGTIFQQIKKIPSARSTFPQQSKDL